MLPRFSSVSLSKFSRSLLYFPSRMRVIKGVAIARIAKSTKISFSKGHGVSLGCVILMF